MLAACMPGVTSSNDTSSRWHRRSQSLTTWYINLPTDESLQFLKEEKTSDAIYSIYLKKICYHSALSEKSKTEVNETVCDSSNSTFNEDLDQDDQFGKAHLQWTLEEVRVLRFGTIERLVRSLASETGDLDSSYVNTFLATYRAFTTTEVVLNYLLKWYETCLESTDLSELKKDGYKRSIRTVISMWLDTYPVDFHEPPTYSSLCSLRAFARLHMSTSDLPQRCRDRIAYFRKLDEISACVSTDDVCLDFNLSTLSLSSDSSNHQKTNKSLFESVTSRHFAEQLTCVDADLFRKLVVHQCLGSVWSRRHESKEQADKVSSVYATINQFNAVSHYVVATVLQPRLPLAERACIIERWISIAQELRFLKNFSSLKAIISGLQSISVYRLRRTWMLVRRVKAQQFEELALIFCDDDNQRMCRELLYREGTAKFADPETSPLVTDGNKSRQSSCLQSLWPRRSNPIYGATISDKKTVQGTVPYLGIFLTDLMMIDSALKDFAEGSDKLINFDKRRKEFEILSQIRLWQSAAGLYRISQSSDFWQKFREQRIYDESESYVMSCEIECDVPNETIGRRTARRRRRDSSLSFFNSRSSHSESLTGCDEMPQRVGCWPSSERVETQSLHSDNGVLLKTATRSRPLLRLSSSTGVLTARPVKRVNSIDQGQLSGESVVARVYLRTTESDKSSHYKSILLCNSDRTTAVLQKALLKYNITDISDNFSLHQIQANRSELELPGDANVFYAVDLHQSQPIEFIVRRRKNSAPQKLQRK